MNEKFRDGTGDRSRAWDWLRQHAGALRFEGLTWLPLHADLVALLEAVREDERRGTS